MTRYHVQRSPDDAYCLIKNNKPLTAANRFLRGINLRGLSLHTVRAYAFDLVFLYRWLDTFNKPLKKLTQTDLVEFIAHQRELNAKPRSINRRLTTCESFYAFCYDQTLPGAPGVSYPAPYYRGPGRERELGLFQRHRRFRLRLRVKIPKTLIEPLDVSEVNAFLKQLTRYRDMAIVLLMLLCGLRSCEVLSLRQDNIDFAQRLLRLTGKGNKERLLPFPEPLVATLQAYLSFERPAMSWSPRFFVILQGKRRGHAMTPAGLRSLFRHRRFRGQIPKAHPHRFRHTFGADMARSGVGLPALQRLMGHADPETTLQYIRLSMTDIAREYHQAIERIQRRYEEI